jgi:hypothetical protein
MGERRALEEAGRKLVIPHLSLYDIIGDTMIMLKDWAGWIVLY